MTYSKSKSYPPTNLLILGYVTMKWETVKKTVADQVHWWIIEGRNYENMSSMLLDMISSGNFKPAHEAFPEYAAKAREVIMNWDIRCVGRLREVLPQFFPPSLKSGHLIAEYDENGDWVIFKAS